jgi:hypothetical protein
LWIRRQGANRKLAAFFGCLGANVSPDLRAAFKHNLEEALLITRRIDVVIDVRRNVIPRMRRGFDGAVFVPTLLFSADIRRSKKAGEILVTIG